MEDKNKINNFYLSFIRQYRNCFPYHIERCIIEEYRNNLSRLFKIPSGHRWQYKEWYPIQEYAMQLLVNDGFISKESKEFYCKPIK
jgi:hypothetical protein